MPDPYITTEIQTGIEFSKYMSDLKYKFKWNDVPFGYQINNASTDPEVSFIDKYETVCTPPPDFFYNHELYLWTKCLLTEVGVVAEDKEKDRNGSNIDKTGASGDVMTYIPNGQYAYKWESDADVQIFKFAPYYSNHRGFDYYPHCFAGGGTKRDHFFTGTYKAGLKDDNGTLKFNSCAGVQPWTGGQMRALQFNNGNTEFTVGETIIGATSAATGTVVSWHKSSGEWTGTAAGTVYIRNYGVDASTATAFGSSETLIRSSGSASTNGSQTIMSLTIDNALTYARNKGAGWEISDIYSIGWIQGLLYAQLLTRDSQTAIGKGTVDLPSGVGYAGLLNGANNIDSNINQYGTGIGDVTDGQSGQTPVEVNNICDLWGGCGEFIAGINVMTDGTVHLINPDGTKTITGTLAADTYIILPEHMPLTDGFIKTVQNQSYDTNPNHAYGAITFLPLTAGGIGSGATYKYCDYTSYPRFNPSIMYNSGGWYGGLNMGIGYKSANVAPNTTGRNITARLKYIPQT